MCAPRAIEKPVTLPTRSRVGRWAEFIVDEYRIMRTLWTLWPSGLRRQIKENTRRNYGKNNARDASRARARFRTMREQSQRNILVRKGVGSNPTGVIARVTININPHLFFLLITHYVMRYLSFLARITGRSCWTARRRITRRTGRGWWSGFWTCARGSGTGRRRRTSRSDMLFSPSLLYIILFISPRLFSYPIVRLI